MKIAFYSPHLCLRGTEITMYDFADYNEKILGNESIIIYNDGHHSNDDTVIKKFNDRFKKVYPLKGPNSNWGWDPTITVPLLDDVLTRENCYGVYMQKFGYNDGVISKFCKTFILCAAPVCDPHGDVYAYVSEWLSEVASGGKYPSVPSMVTELPKISENLRDELNIPKDAIVFGRTGGEDTWNLSWASSVVTEIVNRFPDRYFIFQNTPKFYEHNQIKFIKSTADLNFKTKFINSCDAMIHARNEGESFGCACGEFSNMNKPIITWFGSKDRNHIKLLGDKGIYYNTPMDLYEILHKFKINENKDWKTEYIKYNPERIMRIFEQVYLKPI